MKKVLEAKILGTLTAAIAAILAVLAAAPAAHAAVSAEEAAKLKTVLTPFGAERAGNKEGSIPEWTGCPDLKAPMEKLKSGDRRWDPYESEKPLVTITADNMKQYADKLSDGVQAVLKKYPKSFQLQVYKTHRTHCAPQSVYDNTFRNATNAKLVESGANSGIQGAVGGVAFPIPKNGLEARWNHNFRWRGTSWESKLKQISVTATGDRVLGSQALQYDQLEHYRPGLTSEQQEKNGSLAWLFFQMTEAPSFRAGEGLVARDRADFTKEQRGAWQYLVGQRRVRRAPNIGWDTPDFVNSGANFFDEVFGSLVGSDERHDYKLVGKREIFIPYNNNKIFKLKEEEIFGKEHHNPDAVRWELHRVWQVEATVKQGRRHAVPKRIFYIDEDTWSTALMDGWDAAGNLQRVSMDLQYYLPDMPGVFSGYSDILYVLNGAYSSRNTAFYEPGFQLKPVPMKPESAFSPDALAGSGLR